MKVGVIGVGAVGATDRSDPQGRLRLLDTNAKVYAQIVPQVASVAPEAVLMVVTDPPDPLADLTRRLAGHNRVFSTGTLIDSLRFRVHLADRLRVRPRDVRAVLPVAAYSPRYEVTLSLVSVLGAGGVQQLHEPAMSSDERAALERSAAALRQASSRVLAAVS